MSRTEAYEDLIDGEHDGHELQNIEQPTHRVRFSTQEQKLKDVVVEFVEAFEDWETNAYKTGPVVATTRLPNWEALGRKYYDIYLKAKKLAK